MIGKQLDEIYFPNLRIMFCCLSGVSAHTDGGAPPPPPPPVPEQALAEEDEDEDRLQLKTVRHLVAAGMQTVSERVCD